MKIKVVLYQGASGNYFCEIVVPIFTV